MRGLLRRYAPRNDARLITKCRRSGGCFVASLLAMTGPSHYNKYPSFKFAQTIILFARRALLSVETVAANHLISPLNQLRRIYAPNQHTVIARRLCRRSNPLIVGTPLFNPSLRAQQSNPLTVRTPLFISETSSKSTTPQRPATPSPASQF